MAPISVGDSVPDGQLGWFDENDQLQQVSTHTLAAGKKVILFSVPGAFTPTCSNSGSVQGAIHMPQHGERGRSSIGGGAGVFSGEDR